MRDGSFQVMNIVGTRPNMMKIAPLMASMSASPYIKTILVHTGQHYDYALSDVFFEQLGMRAPDYNLEVGSGTHHSQTAAVMERFGELVTYRRPDLIVVAGDVNSTLACALVGAKEMIPVAHVESGLRSFDRSMPEEINRVMTDSISELLFTTEEAANENLKREGIPDDKVHFVGNTMIDSLARSLEMARQSPVKRQMNLRSKKYVVLTLHRPANVDNPVRLAETLEAISEIAREIPVIFPMHPRTKAKIQASGFHGMRDWHEGAIEAGIFSMPPASYFDFIGLVDDAAFVITDSGGLQEETTYLGVKCLTFRDNTERPITASCGTNFLVGTDPKSLLIHARAALQSTEQNHTEDRILPPLWDGKTADRITRVIEEFLFRRNVENMSEMSSKSLIQAVQV